MKIAITGANGFLGSHLVNACLAKGYEVVALVRPNADISLLPDASEGLQVFHISYSDTIKEQFAALIESSGAVDCFIHNAGLTVSRQKEQYFTVNTHLTKSIVDAVAQSGLLKSDGKLVYVSSYAAHGPWGIGRPVSSYGESKLLAEDHIKSSPFSHLIFRPTAIYGEGDLAFLPLFKTAKNGFYPVITTGQKISMVHAEDLAACIASELHEQEGTLHVSDGNTYTHSDFVEAMEKAMDKRIQPILILKSIARLAMRSSIFLERIQKKKPTMTLEKFSEINQNWHLHESELKHSNHSFKISLVDGFTRTYQFYKENHLI